VATLNRISLTDSVDLLRFSEAVEAQSGVWAGLGITHRFHRPHYDPPRPKTAAWITIEHELAGGQLIVWETGEAELTLIYFPDGATQSTMT
jgi:hypothetical protein